QHEMVLLSALIVGFSRNGQTDQAEATFETIVQRNIITWTGFLTGYAQSSGQCFEAVEMLTLMMWEGFVPDESVFTGVLAACSHQGLLELGVRLFSLMVRDYSIAPALVHFKCLIALLTRAGQLDSAEQLVNETPYHPDEVAWVTLLAGC
ncbi:hypothetical protein SELMODRAFT_16172, partial [Selaginella moellendorffii]